MHVNKAIKILVLICILKGAVYFATKLSQEIKNENTVIDFMKVSSYSGTESTGKINVKLDLSENIENKSVIVIEDIVDTGLTLSYLRDYLLKINPKTLKNDSTNPSHPLLFSLLRTCAMEFAKKTIPTARGIRHKSKFSRLKPYSYNTFSI